MEGLGCGSLLPGAAAGRLAELGGEVGGQGGAELPGFALPSGVPAVLLHWNANRAPAALRRVREEGATQSSLTSWLGVSLGGSRHAFVLHGSGEEEEDASGHTNTRFCFAATRMHWCVLHSAHSVMLLGSPVSVVVQGRFPAAAVGTRAAAALLDMTLHRATVPVLSLFEGSTWAHTHLADSQAVCEAALSPGHSQLGAVLDTPITEAAAQHSTGKIDVLDVSAGAQAASGKGFMGGIRRMLSSSPTQRAPPTQGGARADTAGVTSQQKACAIWAHVFSAVVAHTTQEGLAVLLADVPSTPSPGGQGQLRLVVQAAADGDAAAQAQALQLQDEWGIPQAAHALAQSLVQCTPPPRGCTLTLRLPAAAAQGGDELQGTVVSYVRPSAADMQLLPSSGAIAKFLAALQDGGGGLLQREGGSDSDSEGGEEQGHASLDALWESVRCGAPDLLPPVPSGVLGRLQVAVATARERAAATGVQGGSLPLSLALDDTEQEGTMTGLLLAGSAVLSPLLGGVAGSVMGAARAGIAEDVHAFDMGVPLTSGEATRAIIASCLPELLRRVPCDTLLGVMGALLTERKVVLVAASESGGAQPVGLHALSCCVLALAALLRPLAWAMPLLCPVPSSLSMVLQSPVPLLVGVQTLPADWEPDDECVLLALDTGIMHCSSGDASQLGGDDLDESGAGLPLSLLMQPPLMSHLHHLLAPGALMVREHMTHLEEDGCSGPAVWDIPAAGWQVAAGYAEASVGALPTAAVQLGQGHTDSIEAMSEVQEMVLHVASQLQAYITAVLCSALHIGGRSAKGKQAAAAAARSAGGNEWPMKAAHRGSLWDILQASPGQELAALRSGTAVWHRDTQGAERDDTAHAALALCNLASTLHHSSAIADLLGAGEQLHLGTALRERGRDAEEPFWARLASSQMMSAWRNMWERSRQWAGLLAAVRPCDVAFVLQDVLVGAAEDRAQLLDALQLQATKQGATQAGPGVFAPSYRPASSLRATRLSLARARRGSVSLTASSLAHSHGSSAAVLGKSPLAVAGPAVVGGFQPSSASTVVQQGNKRRPSSARHTPNAASSLRLAPVLSPVPSSPSPAVASGVLPASADAFWAQQDSASVDATEAFSMSGEYASQHHSLGRGRQASCPKAGAPTSQRPLSGGNSTSESDDDEFTVPKPRRASASLRGAGSRAVAASGGVSSTAARSAASGGVRIRVEGGGGRTAMQWPTPSIGMAQEASATSPHYLARRGMPPPPSSQGSGWGGSSAPSVWEASVNKPKTRRVRLG